MYAKLKLLGDGSSGNPWRVDMQNCSTVDVDYVNRFAIVSFGLRDGPPTMPVPGTPLYPFQGDKYVLIGLPPADLQAWWDRLAYRYPMQQPPFKPQFP